jgi:hypothetical protein
LAKHTSHTNNTPGSRARALTNFIFYHTFFFLLRETITRGSHFSLACAASALSAQKRNFKTNSKKTRRKSHDGAWGVQCSAVYAEVRVAVAAAVNKKREEM